jgi:hypothetical protein
LAPAGKDTYLLHHDLSVVLETLLPATPKEIHPLEMPGAPPAALPYSA